MKVTTINGETLRKEFTAIEAAALKHAAEYCVGGDQFTGVPTSNEERYRLSKETFGVIEHDGNFVDFTMPRIKLRLLPTSTRLLYPSAIM